ncbi:MAG TPA: hypothetical protein VF641_02490 [Methylobacterium sp.]
MLLRDTLLYLPAGVLGPIVQLGTLVVLTHWLTPAELGLYALVVALQDLVHVGGVSWWSQYVLRYLADRGRSDRTLQDRTELGVLSATSLAQAALLPGLVLAIAGEAASPALIASVAAASVMRSVILHWSVRARAEQRIGLYGLAQTLAPALSLALALLLFLVFAPSVTLVFAGMAVAHLVVAALIGPRLGLAGRLPALDRPLLRSALRYGGLTTVGAVFAWVSMQGVRFTTEALLGTAAVGLLSVGWGIGQRIATQVAVLATTAAFPLAVARTKTDGLPAGLEQLAAAGPFLAAAILPATAGLILVAGPLADLATAEPFREATAMILPYAILAGAVRVVRHHFLDEALQLAERPGTMTALDALEAIATIAFCTLGALWFGLVGSVVGCLAASALATCVALAVVIGRIGLPLSPSHLVPSVLATVAMAAAVAAMPRADTLAGLAGTILVGAAIYALTLGAIEHRRLRLWLSSAPKSMP